VALLSTQPADLPLPRTALRRSFNLLTLRARCVEESINASREGQDGPAGGYRTLRRFSNRASDELHRVPAIVLNLSRTRWRPLGAITRRQGCLAVALATSRKLGVPSVR
jgi:hypothetical protein